MIIIPFKHSGYSGDIIYALPAIRQACRNAGPDTKADIYLWLNRAWDNYDNGTHPTKGILDKTTFDMLKPLLEAFPYVNEVKEWHGERCIDLDVVKVMGKSIGQPISNMSRLYFYAYPDLACDLSEQNSPILSLSINEMLEGIIINRTERWLNPHISYHFLNDKDKYPFPIWFIGTLREYDLFRNQVPRATYVKIEHFREIAWYFKFSPKLFIGNQSMCYALAEQMKVPRILECCPEAPNVQPHGPNGYDFYTQEALEYYVSKLIRE